MFDSQTITFACPSCGQKIEETAGRLKHDPEITCPACGKVTAIDANQLRHAERTIQESLDAFRGSLGKFLK